MDCGVATRSLSISSTSSIFAFIFSISVSNCDLSCSMALSEVVVVWVPLLRREDLECLDDFDRIERREYLVGMVSTDVLLVVVMVSDRIEMVSIGGGCPEVVEGSVELVLDALSLVLCLMDWDWVMLGIAERSEARAVKTPSLHFTIYTHELVDLLYCAMTTVITVPLISARSPSLYSCGVIEVESSRSSCGGR